MKNELDLHLILTCRIATTNRLIPETIISSGREPFDYAVMTPDHRWHYYARREGQWGPAYVAVNVVGEDLNEV